MAIETRITGDAEWGHYIKMLVVGEPGAGKSLMASTAPNVFYAVADGRMMSLARRHLPYAKIDSTEDLQELAKILRQEPDVRAKMLGRESIDTIVLDTVDEIQRLFMTERVKATKKEAFILQDYQWLKEKMEAFIRGYRNLDMNVIFNCHLKESRDEETGVIYFKPGLQGQSADFIPGAVDLALVLFARSQVKVVDGKQQTVVRRYLQSTPNAKFSWVKDHSGQLPPEFDVNFVDDFDRLFELVYGDLQKERDK